MERAQREGQKSDWQGSEKIVSRSRIELHHLRYVIAAADHGSFRRAGSVLGVDQSVVSRRIRDIEEEIGSTLFRRHHDGVKLTKVGRQFLDRARGAVNQIGLALSDAEAMAKGTAVLKVGFIAPLSTGFLSQLFEAFRRDRPEVRLEFVEDGTPRLIAAIRRGQLDLGFVAETRTEEGFTLTNLWRESVCIAMSKADPLAERGTVTWDDVGDRHFVVINTGADSTAAGYLFGRLRERGYVPNIERQSVTRESLMHIVASGGGLTITSSSLIGLGPSGVIFRPIEGEVLQISATRLCGRSNPALDHLINLATSISERDETWFADHYLMRPGNMYGP